MSIYDELFVKYGLSQAHKKIIKWTGKYKEVLEFGCGAGYISNYLVKNHCEVTGVEYDKNSAKQAELICSRVINGNMEEKKIQNKINGKFDVILFMDVLEHLCNPYQMLIEIKKFLNPDGVVLISLPNIAHWSVRANLLFGKFEYEEAGILDKTHLRFFTFDSAKKMFCGVGLEIQDWDVSYKNDFLYIVRKFKDLFAGTIIVRIFEKTEEKIARFFPCLFGFQMLFKLKEGK